ncbi:hypothetical protein [Sphingobium boeckii]|uniref:Lipoprotein n=1 Tax=Sphingobium boeckii TaxID=1082345 RepID=A0A7W9AEU4_9SPHN|nr:hypothetical protein [Sphingobium boeckii]MBB5684370.1 hypothetical protein [Sphingobium boeckii]
MARHPFLIPTALALALSLAACSKGEDRNAQALNALDQALADSEGTITASADVMKAAGGKLIPAPKPVKPAEASEESRTLGGLAAQQASTNAKRKCSAKVDYAMSWAERLPGDMPIYPGGGVTEAAGETGGCALRVVNFKTDAPLQDIMDFYYTRAVRSGFSAEHIVEDKEHMLGGTRDRDDGAYLVIARAAAGGGTDVDLIANNGR